MKEILDILTSDGYVAYVVGGYVRDFLLGKKTSDIDISTDASIETIEKLFNGKGKSDRKYFAYHIKDNDYDYDITSFRKEILYSKNKPIKIEKTNDLKIDASRRDFTINAIYMDKDNNIIDPFDGRSDIENKRIKVIGNTYNKFNEDATRILRAIRLYVTLNFELDETILLFLNNYKYMLNRIPKEYKRKELDKIFESEHKSKFFDLVKKYDLFDYLNINYDKIDINLNLYQVWACIYTTLPFSKEEMKIINSYKIKE